MNKEKNQLNIFKNYKNLEDNITHGFISLLKCVKDITARNIIKELTDIKLKSDIIYDIQSPSLETKEHFQEATEGYILGISSIATYITEDITDAKGSRPDAWITDGNKVILIESKVVSHFSGDQLNRHEKKLNGYELNVKPRIEKTWQDVDSILKTLVKENRISNVEEKLISDYRRFLQMEGITLDFEKFFNAGKDNKIGEHWFSNEPKITLQLLKERLSKKIDIVTEDKEQKHQTRANFYWLRLFNKDSGSFDWRGTIYLNPDSVGIGVSAFKNKINKGDIPLILDKIKKISEKIKVEHRPRTWICISNYGIRGGSQSSRDYEYQSLNFNLEESENYLRNFENLRKYAESVRPKQIGIKRRISNPSFSENSTYWNKEKEGINYEDAIMLKNPDKVVKNFAEFLELSLGVIKSK